MVFHNSKRRVRATAIPEVKSPITEFPDELLLNIFERTDSMNEILRLRETCKRFLPACNTMVQARLKTLYVRPAPSAVKRAIGISHSEIGSEIEEICFVNKVHWSVIRKDYSLQKDYAHNWPSKASYEKMTALNPAFATQYDEFLSSLADLPKVTTLSFKDACDEPGFNMIAAHIVRDWVSTVKDDKPIKEAKATKNLYGNMRGTPQPKSKLRFNFADLDAIVSMMSRGNFTTLQLCEELPFANAYTLNYVDIGKLTHVELHIHMGWSQSSWQHFCHELLRHAAPTLQQLKLAFRHNPAAVRRKRPETSLKTVVDELDFPELRHLELCALELPNEVPYAPQILNFTGFLEQHCPKLEFLRAARVLPTQEYVAAGEDFVSMDEILLDLEKETKVLHEHDENTRAWAIGSELLEK